MIDRKLLLKELDAGRFEQTESGVLIPAVKAKPVGEYFGSHNGGPFEQFFNTMTNEFFTYVLNAALTGNDIPITQWYMTLFGIAQTPSEEWTAASFAALNTENTSTTEGYDSPTRPAFAVDEAVDAMASNSTVATRFTFATATDVTIGGAAILSSDVRGGSNGVLASAANLPNSRTFENGDTYDLIYRLRFVV